MPLLSISSGFTNTGTSVSINATAAGQWALAFATTFCNITSAFTGGWNNSISGQPDAAYLTTSGAGIYTYASSNLGMGSIGWGINWEYICAILLFKSVPTVVQTVSPGNHYTVTLGSSVTTGNTVLACLYGGASPIIGTGFAITDTYGNTWKQIFYTNTGYGAEGYAYMGVYMSQNVTGGSTTYTITPSGSFSNIQPRFIEMTPTGLISPAANYSYFM